MIVILQGADRQADGHLLDPMFEERKRIFVDLLGWDLSVFEGTLEIDQFDGPDATYIIEVDDAGAHLGSMRLLPTELPHIFDTLFSSLAVDGVPRGSGVREITRLCLARRLAACDRLAVRNRLISAMVDHALSSGISAFTGVVRPAFREAVLAMGWRAMPLGPTLGIGGLALGAFRIDIDGDTPRLLRTTGIFQSVSVIERSAPDLVLA